MKTKFYCSMVAIFMGITLFSQTKVMRPLTAKTVAPAPTTTTVVKQNVQVTKPQNKPAPTPTDLQNAVVNIVVGDDGKDYDTKLSVVVNDDNKRIAGYYGLPSHDMLGNPSIAGTTMGEYFPGDNETVPITLEASVPTGQVNTSKYPPLPVVREANVSDFANGGTILMRIYPNGHDTWKINSFSVTLYFNNDSGSPHKITWNGFTVAQDSPSRILEFDKNFNPIQ